MLKHIPTCLLLASLWFWNGAACAQSVTPQLWRKASPSFRTESQLRALAKRYENNSRMSYYLILRAFNQGKPMSKRAVMTYYDFYQADTSNVRVQAAFAFAHFLATRYDLERGPLQDPELEGVSWLAFNLRPRTVEALPKDPTILLMAARPTYFLNMVGIKENLPDMRRGINWAKQSIRYERNWAESHYWLAKMLQYFAMNHPITATKKTDENIKRQSIVPALAAMRLGERVGDRATQVGSWYLLASAYSSHQKQLSLSYLDKYYAAIPPLWQKRFKESYIPWRKSLIDDIAKSRNASG